MSDIYAVLNIFTHTLKGPFADDKEALNYIEAQDDPCGFTVLPMSTAKVRDDQASQIRQIVKDHMNPPRKIQAIKEVRGAFGMSLLEAKNAVEREWLELTPF